MVKNIRDVLALALELLVIPGLWVLQGYAMVNLPAEAVGASIAVWTLVAQFYFRKATTAEGEK